MKQRNVKLENVENFPLFISTWISSSSSMAGVCGLVRRTKWEGMEKLKHFNRFIIYESRAFIVSRDEFRFFRLSSGSNANFCMFKCLIVSISGLKLCVWQHRALSHVVEWSVNLMKIVKERIEVNMNMKFFNQPEKLHALLTKCRKREQKNVEYAKFASCTTRPHQDSLQFTMRQAIFAVFHRRIRALWTVTATDSFSTQLFLLEKTAYIWESEHKRKRNRNNKPKHIFIRLILFIVLILRGEKSEIIP